jgi:hypothetical protein
MLSQDAVTKYKKYVDEILCVFDDSSINYTLDAGTLLKAYRGDDIFDDHDFDIAIFDPDLENILHIIGDIRQLGYRVRCQGNLNFFEDLFQIEINLGDDVFSYMDVYIYYAHKNEYYRRCIHKPLPTNILSTYAYAIFFKLNQNSASGKGAHFISLVPFYVRLIVDKIVNFIYKNYCYTVWNVVPCELITGYKYINIQGGSYRIVSLPEKYLQHRYGKGWRHPDPHWDFTGSSVYRIRRPGLVMVERQRVECDMFSLQTNTSRDKPMFYFSKRELKRIEEMDCIIKPLNSNNK